MEQQEFVPVHTNFIGGESYEVLVRGHRFVVDQPIHCGGADSAPTPVEFFVGCARRGVAARMPSDCPALVTLHGSAVVRGVRPAVL